STLSFGDSGLAQGTSYSYYVVAFDSAGNLSAHSNSATATTQSTVTTATVEGVMFDASTNNPLVGARATVGSRSGATISQSTTNSQGQYLLSGITPNHTYHYTYVDNHYFNSGFYLAYPAGTNIKNVGLTHK
ncbi:MAG TPA: hypothetical protein VLF63_00640, partial [Patescibacteria group bacterium]|nr:hypothetical protein [Patescibacteria group bacterium]